MSIFNVVDSNDVTAHLPSTMSGYRKYGWIMSLPKGYEKCKEIVDAYTNMINTPDDALNTVLNYLQIARYFYDLTGDTTHFDGLSAIKSGSCRTFANKYSVYYKDTEPKHSIKNYYDLCMKLLPEHMHIGNEWVDKIIQRNTTATNQDLMCEALEVMGQQYVKNVKSYSTNTYSLESVSKDIDTAYKRNQYNTLQDLGIAEQKEVIKNKFNSLIEVNE